MELEEIADGGEAMDSCDAAGMDGGAELEGGEATPDGALGDPHEEGAFADGDVVLLSRGLEALPNGRAQAPPPVWRKAARSPASRNHSPRTRRAANWRWNARSQVSAVASSGHGT